MTLKELNTGQFFAVVGKEKYPKLKLLEGYFDLSFTVRNLIPNPEWEVIQYTEDESRKILIEKEVPMEEVESAINQAKKYNE